MNETLKRSLSGLVYVVLLIFATHFSSITFLVLFGLFLLQTVSEFCNIVNLPKIIALIIAIFIYFGFGCIFFENEIIDLIIVTISLLALVLLMLWLFTNDSITIQENYKWFYLIGYIILPFVFIAKIGNFGGQFNTLTIISIFILIWTNDTFAYIVGKSIGKNKLFEKISPKKTIEGFIGGLICSVLVSLIIAKYFFAGNVLHCIVTAIIVSVLGTIGDLVESKFKRAANIKDSGKIMPGHGGLLDRLDSVIFAMPFLFLFYKIIYYVS